MIAASPSSSKSIPEGIFIDTSVLEANHYDFNSHGLSGLAQAATGKSLTLLLTGPLKEEISRHIAEHASAAIAALKTVRRKHPFLSRLEGWPKTEPEARVVAELRSQVSGGWTAFQKNFQVEDLNFIGVEVDEIMRWYSQGRAPFGTGAKRKEFPDAFTIASLASYAQELGKNVAVVSQDKDLEAACRLYPELLFFPSVGSLVELLLSNDSRFVAAQTILSGQATAIERAIVEHFPDVGFFPERNSHGDVEDIEVQSIALETPTVLVLGHQEFTAVFRASVDYRAYVSYDDLDTAVYVDGSAMPLHRRRGTVSDTADISGIVRFTVDEHWAAVTGIAVFEIDDTDVEVRAEPPIDDDPEPGDSEEPPESGAAN